MYQFKCTRDLFSILFYCQGIAWSRGLICQIVLTLTWKLVDQISSPLLEETGVKKQNRAKKQRQSEKSETERKSVHLIADINLREQTPTYEQMSTNEQTTQRSRGGGFEPTISCVMCVFYQCIKTIERYYNKALGQQR